MRATMHNARTGKNGVFLARHNDRQFDINKADHIKKITVKKMFIGIGCRKNNHK